MKNFEFAVQGPPKRDLIFRLTLKDTDASRIKWIVCGIVALMLAGPAWGAEDGTVNSERTLQMNQKTKQDKQEKTTPPTFIKGDKIWDMTRLPGEDKMRMELTDLARFNGYWYCGFREAFIHHSHPSGRGRVIRSADGVTWESVLLKEWDGADVREITLSVTSEGLLMANTSLAFVSQEARADGRQHAYSAFDRPRPDGKLYGRYYQLDAPGTPGNDEERNVTRQSVTWLSADGVTWSSAYACPSGVNTWHWKVVWHNGMGYTIGYDGKDKTGTLYRTRDGKNWRVLVSDFFPGGGNEISIAFGTDNTAYGLLRDARKRIMTAAMKATVEDSDGHQVGTDFSRGYYGDAAPMFGIGKAPYYQEWEWKELTVDWDGNGQFRSVDEVLRAPFGGPKLIRLKDGRFVVAGRILGPNRDDGHITLFLLDPTTAQLTKIAEFAGSTYGGVAEYDGRLWVSYAGEAEPGYLAVFMASVQISR